MKTILLIIIFIAVAVGGLLVFNPGLFQQREQTISNLSPTPATTSTPDTEIPADWSTYTSNELGISIEHPSKIQIDETQEGIHFLQIGQTQSMGTELYDGLSVFFLVGSLENVSFEEFVQKEYQQIKNDPITSTISELRQETVAGKSAYAFDVSSMGDRTMYYLPKGEHEYVRITNNSVEPSGEERDFYESSEMMINSTAVF